MKKIIFIIIIIILTIIGRNVISQEDPAAVDNWSIVTNGSGVKIEDLKIVNENLIYMVTREYTTHLYHFLKRSTDRGNSWKKLDSIQVYSYPDETKKGASICLINENTIIISNTRGIYKYTTNGGSILKLEFSDNGTIYSNLTSKVIFTGQLNNGANILYALLTFQRDNNVCIVQKGKVYKSIDLGETWIQAYNVQPENDFDCINYESIDYKKDDGNKVIVCGYLENKPWGNSIYNFAPIVLYSESGFAVNTPVYNVDLNDAGTISDVYVKSNGEVIYLFRSRSIVNNPIQYTKVFKHIWGTWGNPNQLFSIRSAPLKAAIQHGMSFCGDNDGYIIINYLLNNGEYVTGVYKTTNGGNNWLQSLKQLYAGPLSYISNIKMPLGTYSSNNADLAYLSPQTNELFMKMMDGIYIKAIIDNLYTPLNGITISITNPNQGSFLTSQDVRRIAPIGTLNIGEYQNTEDKIFYKWNDNSSNSINNKHTVSLNPSDPYYKSITAIFKGKNNADNPVAINNPNQVKALRDSIGTIHKIYESIGGIFYSRSTDNGETFQREEIVNAGNLWNQTYPEDKSSASENRNPSLCEIRNLDGGRALSVSNAQNSITACWEHYIPLTSTTGKIQIKVASRQTNGGIDWYKYGRSDATTNLHGVIDSFPALPGFTSKPVVFASANNTYNYSNLYNQFLLVPHLEPSTNGGNKIVVTAKYKNYGIYPSNGYTNDFIIADWNSDGLITDYSVTAEPTYNNNIYNGYELHFAYLRGNLVKYQKVLITLASANGTDFQLLKQVLSSEELISYADNQLVDRSAPDISMKNGYPAICYSGHWTDNRYVYYEENNDNPLLLSIPHYPIWIKYKSPTSSSWVSFGYDNYTQSTNPNIEGAIRDNAFLLSFKKFNTYYQFVRFDVPENYNCNPGSYNQTDAKLVKGSYIYKNGKLGSNNTPLLLTLSNPTQGIYTVGRQPFEITNQIVPINQTDGFSNLVGTIEKNNTSYTLSVGPIIVSNTTSNNNSTDVGFADDTPPQTVQNPVEFNETMKSAIFSLSNNDTLILGSYGSFLTTSVIAFNPIKYHVNLVNFTSGSIHRELFKDTINIEDSIGISYLRGFIINNIPNGTDSFFVQMVVDTVDAGDGDYNMAGVYADNTPPEGDASHMNYKTKVFFENGSNPLSNFGNQLPKDYALSQNYPNPFNPSTTIKFALPKDGFVIMKVYDISGREVARLVNEQKKAGYHDVLFNASNLASGVYFYRIQSNDFVMTKRMVLIK